MKIFKSLLLVVLVFALGLIALACDNTGKELKIENLKGELEIGEELELKLSISSTDVTCTSDDSTVISCEGLKIKALKTGTAKITVKAGELTAEGTVTVVSKEYTVTFKGKDGEVLATVKVNSGEDASAPTVSDSLFDGWDKAFTNVHSDLIVNAKYKAVTTHNVIFINSETGEIIDEQNVIDGEAATAPTVDDSSFIGWDKEFDEVKEDMIIMSVHGRVSKITYSLAGGQFANAEDKLDSYVEGVETALKNPIRRGYLFAGWTLKRNDTKYITAIPDTQRGDISLYANWKEKVVEIEFDFNGCFSAESLIAFKNEAIASFYVDNYNYNGGGFWVDANYGKYSFIGTSSYDPTATFSDRIYIGKDTETGLYRVIATLASGVGSSWPNGAEYVLTSSSSYKAGIGYSGTNVQFKKLGENVGQYVVFDGDFTNATLSNPVNVYFFNDIPSGKVKVTLDADDKLYDGLKVLGGDFTGWADGEGNIYHTLDDINVEKISLVAQFQMKNPVTAINVTRIPSEMLTDTTDRIVAEVVPSNAYFKTIIYTSSNTDVIEVSDTGVLKAKNAGKATITMVDYVKKIKEEREITVYSVDSIDVSFETENGADYSGTLKIGDKVTIKAESYGKNLSTSAYTFVSSNPSVATVDNNGLVTAVANGTTSIKVTDSAVDGFEVNITVIVNDLTATEKLDKVLELIAANNFALVEAGNISLMDNGSKRDYVSTYGSVNRYLFSPFTVIDTYTTVAREQIASHAAGWNCKLRTDWHGGIEFVTVHDTATTTGHVEDQGRYLSSTGDISIHYTVGDDKILSVIPEEYIAYHAGDGTGTQFQWYDTGVAATNGNVAPEFDMVQSGGKYYFVVNGQQTTIECPTGNGSKQITNPSKDNFSHLGPVWKVENGKYYMGTTWVDFSQRAAGTIGSHGGNNNSIGIEMCVNYAGDIYDTWQRTAQLVADICLRNNLDLTRVKQHNTWTGKNCPQCLIAADYWWGFMKMVEVNYILMKDYSDVQITMKSNSDLVDNTGRVVGRPETTTTVSYDVTVTCGNDSKTITLYSVIPGATTWQQWDGVYPSSKGWKWGISK